MPLHSAPTNSNIFAQKARERAAQVLNLKEEHPGLMMGETPQPTVANRLKRHAMPIMMFMMMLVMLPTMAHMVKRNNNNAAAAASAANNLRANGGEIASLDDEDEETSTYTSTFTPTGNNNNQDQVEYVFAGNNDQDNAALVPGSPEFCVDDPDYRRDGEEALTCEWLLERHTANRCDHVPTLEHCRATCHPKCNGGVYEILDEILEEAEEDNWGEFEEDDDMDVEDEPEQEESDDDEPEQGVSEQEKFEQEEDEIDMDSDDEEDDESVSCIDDANFRYQGNESKDCNWASAKFTNFRCGFPEVLAACPATCSPECGTFPPTSDGTFPLTSDYTFPPTSDFTFTSSVIRVSMDEDEMLSI